MKRIAYLSDGWHRLVAYVPSKALIDEFKDFHEDTILCQFNCFGNWSRDDKHNKGEYNIYNLPDLTEFDGIVLDCNSIEDMAMIENVIRIVKAANRPTVSVGMEVEGFYYAGIDNKRPIYELMEHLYNKHGCRSFVFAGGPITNGENELRKEAYKEFLGIYNLDIMDNPVLIGNFDFMSGCKHFNDMVTKHIPIPDAFVCANDNIAAGLIDEAGRCGFNVPEDFLVTGFDNLDKASYFQPQISTVGYDREDVGVLCANVLKEVWSGDTPKSRSYCELEYFFTESCGCKARDDVDYRDFSRDRIISAVQIEVDEAQLMDFDGKLAKCTEFDEIFQCAGEYFSRLDCDEIYFFVDDRLFSAGHTTSFPKSGYDWNHIRMVYAIKDKYKTRFKSSVELLGYLEQDGGNNIFLFTPIHFGDETVGFSVIKNADFLQSDPYFYDIHSTIVKALNNLFRTRQLENANKALNKLYITDAMTGAYNRIAFTKKILPSLTKYHKDGIPCGIAFADTDDFKHINDTYGHAYGDKILKTIADTLYECCPKDGYVCRYGGDEFVVFVPLKDGFNIEEYRDLVYSKLALENVKISMGTITTSPDSKKTFDEYLLDADHRMYDEKKGKKRN